MPCVSLDPTTCPRDLSAYTPEVWEALAEGGGGFYLELVYGSDFGPALPGVNQRTDGLALVQEANTRGIPVKAWLIAPVAHGTFANEQNADFFDAAVKAIVPWIHDNGLQVDELVLDLELPLGYQVVLDATNPSTLLQVHAPIDPAHQCAAMRQYASTVSWAHREGFPVAGSPMPFLIDDLLDGNLALADVIDGAPTLPRGLDHVYVQAYRTYSDAGADYVSDYFSTTQSLFGAPGQVTIGDTSMGSPPYSQLAPAVADIRMLAAMGATDIPIFSLEGSVKAYGAGGIRQLLAAAAQPMSADELAAATVPNTMSKATRTFFSGLNAVASTLSPDANAWPDGCADISVEPLRATAAGPVEADLARADAEAATPAATDAAATARLPATGGTPDLALALLLVAVAMALRPRRRPS
jgi:hypothetical protein